MNSRLTGVHATRSSFPSYAPGQRSANVPDPQKDLKIRSNRTIGGKSYKDYTGVIMGLYRGSNF